MAEVLLLNPRKRRTRRKGNPKARAANPRRRRRNPIRVSRRSNPRPHARRRRNPIRFFAAARRRRRNPISLGGLTGSSIVQSIKGALIGAAGAYAVDFAWARLAPMLPANLRPMDGKVDVGDAVKMLFTILLGRALKGPTRGASMDMARGALTVQAHGILKSVLPASLLSDAGMGYWSPAGAIDDGTMRVGPAIDGYVTGSALLNEYTEGSGDVLLNDSDAFEREGVSAFR